MKQDLAVGDVAGDARYEASMDPIDGHFDDDLPTPVDSNAVRWVLASMIVFWLVVYWVARHFF